jgi:hypothetical protein
MIKKKIFALLLLIATNICFSSYAKNLKGLMPIDVYSKMEKRGFTTKYSDLADDGDLWMNEKKVDGNEYQVTYGSSGKSKSSIESVEGWVMIDPRGKISSTMPFFIFIASLPYEGSNPKQAEKWIKNNFNKKRATTKIGEAKITIVAPSIWVRMMTIEPIN